MKVIMHVLRFAGLLCLLGILARYVPGGGMVTGLVVMAGLWKLSGSGD